ncbi:MAG: glycosyltransferase family 4 protein [Parcubacteria group bacterium]|nr:glycosyltransferase family 4 protein [Parcubacteria group bacterium]
MKKILIFSLTYYPSFVSGAEAAIREVTERIDDIEFHLITLLFDKSAPREEMIGNVMVHRIGFGGGYISKILFIPLAAFKAKSLHKKHSFSALWAVMTYMFFPLVFSKFLGVKVPHVLTLQDGDPYEKVFARWFIRPFTPILDYGFRNASVIQVISTYLGTWPEKRGYKGEIEFIHNGANPRDIKAEFSKEEIESLKRELGKKAGDIFIGNTARLVHQKGNDDTIRAMQILPENVKLLLVGGGSDEKMLKNLTKELGLEDRVIFTGPVDRSVVSNYRQTLDIFVGPSRSEGLGNAFLSAMASRLPVVSTQEGGIAEFLFDKKHNRDMEQTGWVVDKDSPEQIAFAVKDILANPKKVEEVKKTARSMVLEKFNWDKVAVQMRERVFSKVL